MKSATCTRTDLSNPWAEAQALNADLGQAAEFSMTTLNELVQKMGWEVMLLPCTFHLLHCQPPTFWATSTFGNFLRKSTSETCGNADQRSGVEGGGAPRRFDGAGSPANLRVFPAPSRARGLGRCPVASVHGRLDHPVKVNLNCCNLHPGSHPEGVLGKLSLCRTLKE